MAVLWWWRRLRGAAEALWVSGGSGWWRRRRWRGGRHREGARVRDERRRRLGFSPRGMGLIYNRREMTIMPIEFGEITTPATARKNGRPRSNLGSIGRPRVSEL